MTRKVNLERVVLSSSWRDPFVVFFVWGTKGETFILWGKGTTNGVMPELCRCGGVLEKGSWRSEVAGWLLYRGAGCLLLRDGYRISHRQGSELVEAEQLSQRAMDVSVGGAEIESKSERVRMWRESAGWGRGRGKKGKRGIGEKAWESWRVRGRD